jgi:hypothetical protein
MRALLLGLALAATSCGPAVFGPKACDEVGAANQMVYEAPGTKGVCMAPSAAIFITCLREMHGAAAATQPISNAAAGHSESELTDTAKLEAVHYCAKLAGLPVTTRRDASFAPPPRDTSVDPTTPRN